MTMRTARRAPFASRPAGRLRAALASAAAGALGAAPHVLHHAGPLAGAALVGGALGTVLFGVVGLALTLPVLVRVRRHTGSWLAPAALLALFAAVFTLSTFVLGPALTGDDPARSESDTSQPRPDRPGDLPGDHEAHHNQP